jgi:hypothetical protein
MDKAEVDKRQKIQQQADHIDQPSDSSSDQTTANRIETNQDSTGGKKKKNAAIYVTNIPHDATVSECHDFFKQCGNSYL